jgi:hypothetical protein
MTTGRMRIGELLTFVGVEQRRQIIYQNFNGGGKSRTSQL